MKMKSCVRRTYVVFQGGGMPDEVESRVISKLKIPAWVVAFWFFDLIKALVEVDGKIVELESERLNKSPTYHYGDRLYTREEFLAAYPGDPDQILEWMDEGSWDQIVRDRDGKFGWFHKGDVLIKTRVRRPRKKK